MKENEKPDVDLVFMCRVQSDIGIQLLVKQIFCQKVRYVMVERSHITVLFKSNLVKVLW